MLTRDDVIRLAAESGALRYTNRHLKDEPSHAFSIGMLERFAAAAYAAGAADEREACEGVAAKWAGWQAAPGSSVADDCAIAIRQRATDPRAPGCVQPGAGAGRQAPCRCGPDGCADSACQGRPA